MRLLANRSALTLACVLSLVALVCSVRAKNARPDSPGMQPYTPTRLEWLELELQATYRMVEHTEPGTYYAVDYVARPPDTIRILAHYSKRVSAETVEESIEHCKRMAEKVVSRYGWSPWVKIEVKRELLETPKQSPSVPF